MIKEKDRKMKELERRVDDLEQYARMDNLLISGLKTIHTPMRGLQHVTRRGKTHQAVNYNHSKFLYN